METIQMSQSERRRLEIFSRVKQQQLTLVQAGELLAVSYRQAKRLWARYQREGDAGLVHGLRGGASNHQSDADWRARVLARYGERYGDYGPTLAAECLATEGLLVGVETLRRWLLAAGLWSRQRRSKVHRRRRARREQFGELVQMDGSHHDWFEGRRAWAVLMVMIDDATSRVSARFYEEETLAAAFEMVQRYAQERGLPRALYVDRASIYRSDREPTAAEIIAEIEPQTQFGRAMQSLDVRLILANSPQAKGRVERVNRTLQDRLVKALRQRGISEFESANKFLEAEFLLPFNTRFAVAPTKPADLHRAVPQELDLCRVLAVHEERVVQNDWTIRWQNSFLQLDRKSGLQPQDRLTVCEQLDGHVRLFADDRELLWSPVRSEASRPRKPVAARTGPTGSSQGQKPAANHPWR
ncbi:ISNCY family transposase [Anatilimnocola sp. NA78]|uniref:ISNCY family transposase n=1 Tax=Anatilimnocola sp. NA78 TaxID=3415683 RepID=UPI003CE4789B